MRQPFRASCSRRVPSRVLHDFDHCPLAAGGPGAVVARGVGAEGAVGVDAVDGFGAAVHTRAADAVAGLGVVAEWAGRSNLGDRWGGGKQKSEGKHGVVVQKKV